MNAFLATSAAALTNLLALLGIAFLLSRGFGVLGGRPERQRKIMLGLAFGAMAVGSMMMSFPIGEGVIGDLRNVVVAVAAIVGGPVSALIAAAIAAVYRFHLGGQYAGAIAGIGLASSLSIGFARANLPKTAWNLAVFGIVLAIVNASLPVVTLHFSNLTLEQSIHIATLVLVFASVIYPVAIVVVGGLLMSEQRRAEDEAQLKAANAELSLDAARTQGMFESSGVAMAWSDLRSGRMIRANPQFASFTGYSEGELTNMKFDELSAPEDREKHLASLRPLMVGATASVNDERRYMRKDGAVVWGMRSVTTVCEDGEPRYAFAIVQDITERKQTREEIAYLASHDTLTGLANRLVLQSEFVEAIARRKPDQLVAVLFVDLDNFKEINDTLGHSGGDAILVEVGNRIRGCADNDDIVARFGGHEFAVLRRSTTSAEEIRDLAGLVIGRVSQPCGAGGDAVTPQVSIGIALGPHDGLDADDLMNKADIALHSAKGEGGAYRFFKPAMEEQLLLRQALKVDLTAALSNGEFEVHYQPIVDLRTGDVTSFEALLRWRHPQRGLMPPSEFIPLAEETGLIVPIGDWVMRQACNEAINWPASISVAVNVSPVQFHSRSLALRVAEVVSKSGLSPRRLELEITETILMHGGEENLKCLRDLRLLGVKIALDDFGTGYSSLGYLQRFPFDRIKIDRSFVTDVVEQHEAKAVIRAVIGLGHSLNMRITAEGVESQEQLDRISAKGCDEAQGFLFSRPVRADQVPALIERLTVQSRVKVRTG